MCIFLSWPDETHCMSRIREIITNYGQHEERGRICITWTWQTPSKLHGLVNMLVLKNERLVWKRLCVRNKVFNRLEAPHRKPSLSIAFNISSKTKKYICTLKKLTGKNQATWLTYRERWFKWVTAIRITLIIFEFANLWLDALNERQLPLGTPMEIDCTSAYLHYPLPQCSKIVTPIIFSISYELFRLPSAKVPQDFQ